MWRVLKEIRVVVVVVQTGKIRNIRISAHKRHKLPLHANNQRGRLLINMTTFIGKRRPFRTKDAADLLDIVAAVNGVIDFLPAVWKLCKKKADSSEMTIMKGLLIQ